MPKDIPRSLETTFGKYTLGQAIGQGGSGSVYEATDDTGALFAVKILRSDVANSEKRKRFKNEIHFCERTKHPNIVPVIDHGLVSTAKGTELFYVMPRYDFSLRAVIGKSDTPEERLRIFDSILSGVEAAHLSGVVHRDVKPENILLKKSTNTIVVADFGIAHFTQDSLRTIVETQANTRLANFQYAAPEQRAKGGNVSAAADMYSLGLILNELFTGEVPHGTGYKTIASLHSSHGWLDPIVESLLRQNPSDRPASIAHIKRALISHKNDFVVQQQLDATRNAVVPTTEINDPLLDDPPRIVDFEYDKGRLALILSRAVGPGWVSALHNMGNYTSVWGKGPGQFQISGRRAEIAASEHQVQHIIDHFKSWLPQVTARYRAQLEEERTRSESLARQKLQQERAELEAKQKLRATIRI